MVVNNMYTYMCANSSCMCVFVCGSLKKEGISNQALELGAGCHACACVCFRPPTAFSGGASHSTALIIQHALYDLFHRFQYPGVSKGLW